MDDPFVSCPYDPVHQVPRSRIQRHLIKCERNHPKLMICPYNATHRFPADKIKAHIDHCPSKVSIELNEAEDIKPVANNAVIISKEQWNDDEDWDN